MKLNAVTPSARQMSQKREAEKRSWSTQVARSSHIEGSTRRVARVDVVEGEHVEEHLVLAVGHQRAGARGDAEVGAMREDGALGGAGRARGEEDHGRVVRNDDGVGTTGGPGEQELVRKAFEAGNRSLAEDDDPLQRLEPGGDTLDPLQPLAVDHEHPAAAGVQHVHEHVAAEARVQRHLDEARARDAEPEPEVLGPVAEHHRDPVALDEPEAGERVATRFAVSSRPP